MKITNVTPTERGGYTGQYGYMFTYHVTLDNGLTGEVSCKNENQWKTGDDVEIVSQQTNQYGTKLRLKKPEFAGNRPHRDDRNIQASIDSSWAINAALQYQIANGMAYESDAAIGALCSLAKQMLEVKNQIIAHLNQPNE